MTPFIKERGNVMDLNCTNPNYIEVMSKAFLSKKDKQFRLIDRQEYLSEKSNHVFKRFKTRCGKCLACRIFKGYEWSNRLLAEGASWEYIYFITLTFNDLNYSKVDLKTRPMREMQLFMKRLRKKFTSLKFKYYAVGELGGQTLRFHYHLILYSHEHVFNDMIKLKTTNMAIFYNSSILRKLWKNGNVLIAWAEKNSMRYCANYVQTNDNTLSRVMSKGIGQDYIQKNNKNNMYLINGKYSKVPRYLQEKEYINPDTLNDIRLIDYYVNDYDNKKTLEDKKEVLKKSFYRKGT